LANVNVTIADGECVLLCGRSGCGKTTFTRLINGLIPHFFHGVLSGRVMIDDLNISQTPMYLLAERIGSVFQNPRTQFFNVETDCEIAFGLENNGFPEPDLLERVASTKKRLSLEHLSARSIFELSGGEKQKIAFASVFAMNPEIYLLDEPSSSLDLEGISDLTEKLQILKSQGKTIIIADHRLYYLADIIDTALYFDNNHLAGHYSAQEFLALSETQRHLMSLRTLDLRELKPEKPKAVAQNKPISAEESILEIKNLSISHKGLKILDNINFTARTGEVVGIVGPNGIGKTTFLRTICGLQPIVEGKILFNDVSQSNKKLIKKSYMVMQDVNYQLFAENAEKECILGIKNPDLSLVDTTLTQLELAPFRQVHPNILSEGQKQRLAVSVSLICGKTILVFDEPTSGLDYNSMQRVATLVNMLAHSNKIVLITSHDQEFICKVCNKIFELGDNTAYTDQITISDNISAPSSKAPPIPTPIVSNNLWAD
jgi:energy-coupling factor transport system ATP-binding protein